MYGGDWEKLMCLKRKYDSWSKFRNLMFDHMMSNKF